MEYKCNKCDFSVNVSHIRSKFVDDELIDHYADNGEPIKCNNCNIYLKPTLNEQDFGVPMILTFNSMTPTQRAAVLDKRSKEHFNKVGKEMKHEKLKQSGLHSPY